MSDRVARAGVVALGGLALVVLAALVATWVNARVRALPPRFEPRRFVAVEPASTASGAHGARETWLVPVNLACDHCVARCAELARAPAVRGGSARLVALVVDTPTRPHVDAAALAVSAVLWDSAGVWRGPWGRRAYGEALCFDATGRCRRVVPPETPVAISSP